MAQSFSVATTQGGLTSAFAQAPAQVERIEPRRVRCLDGIDREIGLEGRVFTWELLTVADWHTLAAVCTGIAGYVRTQKWIGDGSTDDWADYSCNLQIPRGAVTRNGAYRYNVRLEVTRMTYIADVSP